LLFPETYEGEQLLDVRRDKLEREAFSALQNEEEFPRGDEEDEYDNLDASAAESANSTLGVSDHFEHFLARIANAYVE
jgi:hypothetical protein